MVNSSVIRHSDNATSVYLRVQALRSEKYNPVLLYKQQNVEDNTMGLLKEDIVLVIMTKEQSDIYKRYASQIICFDSTHKTNQYSFKLITLLVPDEFRKGYPVAFCISNKESETVIKVFLKSVNDVCPDAKVHVIMTDDDNAGWSAAQKVYGHNLSQYLCIWHVHRAWRRKLASLVKDPTHQAEIYSFLCCMLEAKDNDEFSLLRDQFINKFTALEPSFVQYFKENYDNRPEKWALCFCVSDYASVNTNMFVESFHNKLKTIYLGGKRNCRIDTLLQIERDTFINHFRRNIYDIPSNTDMNNRDRHTSSLSIPDNFIIKISQNTYSVRSSTLDILLTQ